MIELLQGILPPATVPGGYAETADPLLRGLHALSDFIIGATYVSISTTLLYFVYRARHWMPFQWVFVAFGAFIVFCGGTHFMHVALLYTPATSLAGVIQSLTVLASLATAVALPPLVPRALALIAAARLSETRKRELEAANTELEGLYAQLKALDEHKTQFFANVSHELRTPLTLILGPTEKLLHDDDLGPGPRRDLESVERNARLLLRHVNDLLDVAKLDAARMDAHYAAVDLARLVRLSAAHFEGLAQERQIAFTVEAPSTLPAAADPEKLQRVLLNLLSNAFKFTPDGGRVRCQLEADETRAQVAVEDSGPGVPSDLREVVFQRFRQGEGGPTRRFGGTGLGLAIAREFVELHGGTITVDEAPLGGARFTVALPLAAPPEVEVAEAVAESVPEAVPALLAELHPTAPPSAHGLADDCRPLVMVVEDNQDMAGFIADTLGSSYRVATAADGQEGLERALALRPDLVVTDVMMPRLSGDQLVRAARGYRELDGVPFVVLTAKADDVLAAQLLRAGAQDYLVKPFAPEELRARVGNLVTLKRTRDVLQAELASQSQDLGLLVGQLATRTHELQRALAARDDFLSSAAHDLKTPLAALLLQAQLLERRATQDPTAPAELPRIQGIVKQLQRMRELVIELLDATRVGQGSLVGERQSVDLVELTRQACAVPRPGEHECTLAANGSVVGEYDAVRLGQLVNNLLDNATKYSPVGSRVEVRVWEEQGEARLQVRDAGIGIAAADLDSVFDRFYRGGNVDDRRFVGLGLGLYFCRAIAEQHGGRIWASSPGPDQGSTFDLALPLTVRVTAGSAG